MDIEKKVWEVLCSEEDLNKRVKELGEQITEDYKDKNLMVISLLRFYDYAKLWRWILY